VTAIPTPPTTNRLKSSVVAVLKCEGTPRACCSDTQATSTVVEAHNRPIRIQPLARRSRSQEATQLMVRVVRPKEIPKLAGLRHDSGPDADPPATAQIAACTSPVAISAAPTT
jgi:hypothetical protein